MISVFRSRRRRGSPRIPVPTGTGRIAAGAGLGTIRRAEEPAGETPGRADEIGGERLFAGLCVSALWNLLVFNGMLPKRQALDALDAVLLTVENRSETWKGNTETLVEVRARLTTLMGQIDSIRR